MSKILILSDVHGDKEILEDILNKYKDADLKIYLGDFQMSKEDQEMYSEMFDHVVTGNCDYPGVSQNTIFTEIEGKGVMITHGHMYGSILKKIDFDLLRDVAKENNCEIVLHGHDHISEAYEKDGVFRFNPGSTTLPRNTKSGTYGILTINEDNWKFDIKEI